MIDDKITTVDGTAMIFREFSTIDDLFLSPYIFDTYSMPGYQTETDEKKKVRFAMGSDGFRYESHLDDVHFSAVLDFELTSNVYGFMAREYETNVQYCGTPDSEMEDNSCIDIIKTDYTFSLSEAR